MATNTNCSVEVSGTERPEVLPDSRWGEKAAGRGQIKQGPVEVLRKGSYSFKLHFERMTGCPVKEWLRVRGGDRPRNALRKHALTQGGWRGQGAQGEAESQRRLGA